MRDEAFELLGTGLRSGADTVEALAALARRDPESVRDLVGELEEQGYVELRGDRIRYAGPPQALSQDVRRRADRLLGELTGMVGELAAVAGELPGLMHSWAIGDEGRDAVGEVDLFHGESAVTDLWHHLLQRYPLRRTDIVLPDSSPLGVADPAMQEAWHRVIGAEGSRARVIGAIADTTAPGMQQRMEQELAAGLQVRTMSRPPSWFWVADESIVALPLQWGEAWPTSVVAVHSPAVAGLASWAFERLWEQAVAVRVEQATWDPLIRLMYNGATLEAASRSLGISERTGRRRLSDAMDHYRAPNLLALGVAWGRGRRPGRGTARGTTG